MSFDITRLRRSDRVIGIGAVLFFIFLFFFKWYGFSSNAPTIGGVNVSGDFSFSGWHTFTNSRWIWLITIIVALGAVAVRMGVVKLNGPVQPGVLVAGLGALSSLLIIYRILDHPTASASFGGVHTSVGIKIGIWLGLIAAAMITYGGYLGMQAEGTSLADVREQASGAFSGMAAAVGGDAAGAPDSATPAGGSEPQAAPPIPPPIPPVGEAPIQQPPDAGVA
jgi:hypothetical protein